MDRQKNRKHKKKLSKKKSFNSLKIRKPKFVKSKSPSSTNPPIIVKPVLSNIVSLSRTFKSQSVFVSEDNFTATGNKGYTSVFSNYPIIEGSYYFEVKILNPKEPLPFHNVEPHVRIGFALMNFKVEKSLGSDENSYAIRDYDGALIHNGIIDKKCNRFKIGDIIGCLIFLKPPKPKSRFDTNEEEKNIGSKSFFFINGVNQGLGFENLKEGFYYFGVSLYMNAKVKVNFGPNFEFQPDLNGLEEEISKFKPGFRLAEEPSKYKDIRIFN